MSQDAQCSFDPRVAPRDAGDAAISLAIGTCQILILFGLPGALVHALIGSTTLTVATVLLLYLAFALYSVTKVELNLEGIRFVRVLGHPRFLPWSEISDVVEASRSELILHGWLWPLVLPREMSPSCTSLGHFRIQFGKRFVYFPPKDPQLFLAAVDQFSKRTVDVV
jgi:hypothetical protein